ncbi:hypothetical protein D029_3061B, partial [Vibrio parahaemolyticus 970107]
VKQRMKVVTPIDFKSKVWSIETSPSI